MKTVKWTSGCGVSRDAIPACCCMAMAKCRREFWYSSFERDFEISGLCDLTNDNCSGPAQ